MTGGTADIFAAARCFKCKLFRRLSDTSLTEWPAFISAVIESVRESGLTTEEVASILASAPDNETTSTIGALTLNDPTTFHRLTRALFRWLKASTSEPAARCHVRAMKQWIEEHFADNVTLGALATAIGREKGYAGAMFRQHVGCSVHQYVACVRIRRAADLVMAGWKIEAAMLTVGYKSKGNFYRQFATTFGVTPDRYRRGDYVPAVPGRRRTAEPAGTGSEAGPLPA
jgi:AraC-like DNA-binding protein